MPAYQERFTIGSPVRIVSRAELEAFRREWTHHNPLADEQLPFADYEAVVADVGFYHGGDPLYVLTGVPGVWHESCLAALQSTR